MKMTKKLVLMKILVYLLCVIILSISVGNIFAGVNDIDTVHAVGPEVALGLDVMYEICEYFGATFLSYSCGRSLPEISDDELARLGHDFLKSTAYIIYETDIGKPGVHADPTPYIGFVDSKGQSYVFGSEALKETAETEFTVIQGGKNDGDDDDDDNDNEDNIIHFPKKVAGAGKLAVALTTSTAATVASAIAYQYNKWVNGDEDNLLEPFFEQYPDITDSDIEEQWSGGTYRYFLRSIEYSGSGTIHACNVSKGDHCFVNSSSFGFKYPLGLYCDQFGHYLACYYINGTLSYCNYGYNYKCSFCNQSGSLSGYMTGGQSFSTNIPFFSTQEACIDYVKSGTGYEDALNYTKEYRNADWLQDDWSGKLLDPLTGLNALSNWYNIARHQGLNALGDDPSLDAMSDYLRDYFTQNSADELPEVDPSLAPVKYPAVLPDVVIDPAINPAISPVTNPGVVPDPGNKPDPGTDPNPGTDTDPGSDTEVTIDMSDYQVDLRRLFPFCIPFDFIALLNALDADPVAPCFNFPVAIPALDYQETVKLDMSMFDDVAKVIRICEKVSFLIFLMFATSKVIRW